MSNHNLCFGAKNMKYWYTPANPSFAIIKVGYNGVCITWKCYLDKFLNGTDFFMCK